MQTEPDSFKGRQLTDSRDNVWVGSWDDIMWTGGSNSKCVQQLYTSSQVTKKERSKDYTNESLPCTLHTAPYGLQSTAGLQNPALPLVNTTAGTPLIGSPAPHTHMA